jgi:outer membrane protein
MGRAYLALGDYARAKLEFETVLRFQNLPPDLREQALIYGKAADDYLAGKKTVGFGYLEYGYGKDSNPLSSTRINEIALAGGNLLILPPSALARSDHYQAFALGGEIVHALTERWSVFAGSDARARKHDDIGEADFGNLDGRVGLGYGEGAHNTRIGVSAGRYWLDDLKVRDTWGLTADYRYLATKQDQFSVSGVASWFKFRPETLKVNNYASYQAAMGWLRAVSDGRGAFGLAAIGGFEKATNGRFDGDRPFYGARLTLQHALTDRVGAFFLGGAQRGKYKDVNPIFAAKREDTLYDLTAGVTWSFAKGWALRPQLQYLKNSSNLPIYEYRRTDVSLNLRVDF